MTTRLWLAPAALILGFSLACVGGDGPEEGGSPDGSSSSSKGKSASPLTPTEPTKSDSVNSGPVACEPDRDTPDPNGCAIAVIECDTTVEGSNKGKPKNFDDDFYQSKYCTPQRNGYADSPEAVWQLKLPPNTQADVYLHGECTDLDLFSLRWQDPRSCPSRSSTTGECEGSTKPVDDHVKITSVARAERHLIWVDGKDGETGNFRIEVRCKVYR